MKALLVLLGLLLVGGVFGLDRDVLIEFWEATGGPENRWTDDSNWNTSAALSLWYGVSVGAPTDVTWLNLPNNGLIGTLPNSLGTLTQCGRFDLNNNFLTGTLPDIPPEAAFGNPRSINVESNSLTGVLPDWVCNLTRNFGRESYFGSLSSVSGNFWDCSLPSCCNSGQIPCSGNTYCTDYYLNTGERDALMDLYNELDGDDWNDNDRWGSDIPYGFWDRLRGNSFAVTDISLNNNNLNGSLDSLPAAPFPAVTDLDMSDNSGLIGELGTWVTGFTALSNIDMSRCGLTSMTDDVFNLPAVRDVFLDRNQITHTLPTMTPSAPMDNLDLTNNNFQGVLPDWICGLGSTGSFDGNDWDCPLPSCCLGPFMGFGDGEFRLLEQKGDDEFLARTERKWAPVEDVKWAPEEAKKTEKREEEEEEDEEERWDRVVARSSGSPSPTPFPPSPSPSPVPSPAPPTPSPTPVLPPDPACDLFPSQCSPTPSPSPSPYPVPSSSPIPSPSPFPFPSPSPVPFPSPSSSPTPTPSPSPSSSPTPSPSSSPTPAPSSSPTPSPAPSPTPFVQCAATYQLIGGNQDLAGRENREGVDVEISRLQYVRVHISETCDADPTVATFQYAYQNSPLNGRSNRIIREGDNACIVNGVTCAGDELVFIPVPGFPANSLLNLSIFVKFEFDDGTPTLEDEIEISILIVPMRVAYFARGRIRGGASSSDTSTIDLNGHLTNPNYIDEDPDYYWTCRPQSSQHGDCPPCPLLEGSTDYFDPVTGLTYYGPFDTPELNRAFDEDLETVSVSCVWFFVSFVQIDIDLRREVAREVIIPDGVKERMTKNGKRGDPLIGSTVSSEIQLTHEPNAFVPDISWDNGTQYRCTTELIPGRNFYLALDGFFFPEDASVAYGWQQTTGPDIGCTGTGFNCGGNGDPGYPFRYIPADDLPSCESEFGYRITVSVTSDGKTGSAYLDTCLYRQLGRPTPGDCGLFLANGDQLEDDECVDPGTEIFMRCWDWGPECPGGSTDFTYQVVKPSDYVDNNIELSSSIDGNTAFLVPHDIEIYARVEDSFGAWRLYPYDEPYRVTVCNVNDREAREISVRLMGEVEDCLELGDLTCAQNKHFAVLNILPKCQGRRNGVILNEAIQQSNQVFDAFFEASGFDATTLFDLTPIMDAWVTLALNSCEENGQLFNNLGLICQSQHHSGAVLLAAANYLLGPMLEDRRLNPASFWRGFDSGILTGECVNIFSGAPDCGRLYPLTFSGGNQLNYGQTVVALSDLVDASEFISPGGQVTWYFPKNFYLQVLKAWYRQNGIEDENTNLWCIVFNFNTAEILGAETLPDDPSEGFKQAIFGLEFTYIEEIGDGLTVQKKLEMKNLKGVTAKVTREPCGNNDENDDDKRRNKRVTFNPSISFDPSERITEENEKRFSLSKEGDTEEAFEKFVYYIYNGQYDPDGITYAPWLAEDYDECEDWYIITHFSNFGLLFGNDSADDWTTLRIVSVALFAATWFFLIVFFLFALYAPMALRAPLGLLSKGEEADAQMSQASSKF